MKLREFNFNEIKKQKPFELVNLCVRVKGNDAKYEGFSIGDTLRQLPIKFADMEIAETRWFFNTFVIELKGEK